MSFFSRTLTAIVGLGLIWFFWPFGGGSNEVVKIVKPPTGHEGRLFTTPLPETPLPEEAPPKKPEPPETTQALPDTETADQPDGKTVAAVDPGAPQGPQPKQKLKATRFYRVMVRDGGTLEARTVIIKLAGIDAYAADEACKDAKGRSWACGTRARVALTRFIRGRAVVCKVPATYKTAELVTAPCVLAGTDLSTWMVSQGWAKPATSAESKLTKAAAAAKKKKVGVWR